MRTITFQDGSVPSGLEVGDQVRVATTDGRTQTFTLTGFDENGLQSSNGSLAYSEISSIEVEQSSGSSMLLVGGVLAVVAIAAAAGGGGGGGY